MTSDRTQKRRGRAAVGAAALALVLAGCGGGDGDAKPAATTASAAPVKATASTPAPGRVLKLADDTKQARAGKRLVLDVLANDRVTLEAGESHDLATEFGSTDLTVAVGRPAGHGTAVVDGTTVVYTPTVGYGGEDEFTYRVTVKGEPPLSGTATVRITVDGPSPSPTPKATQSAKPKVYYRNCDAARAAGAAPVRVGDPGYGRWLDRDGDGIGCETKGGGSGGSSGGSTGGSGGGGATYYKNCAAVRAAGAAPIHVGDPGYDRHLDRDGDGVGCE
ncbi:excalibur calcium-binding domain-containing protein [Streptomyces sp. NPDC050738]|uniref:excalibur calcium-binding domain-containing protein n=1 Tax=Streptomyces sp. NPDC050738 TaxID=3154744 RepID=UPI003434B960